MEIARGVGTPLQLDRATKEREFGYFARILVDVDIASDLPNTLMVERESHCFPVEVMYENLCSNCGVVGHNSDRCRQLQSKVEPHKKQAPQAIRQEYRAKPKPIEEVIISKQTTAAENETDKSLELRDAINGSPATTETLPQTTEICQLPLVTREPPTERVTDTVPNITGNFEVLS